MSWTASDFSALEALVLPHVYSYFCFRVYIRATGGEARVGGRRLVSEPLMPTADSTVQAFPNSSDYVLSLLYTTVMLQR